MTVRMTPVRPSPPTVAQNSSALDRGLIVIGPPAGVSTDMAAT